MRRILLILLCAAAIFLAVLYWMAKPSFSGESVPVLIKIERGAGTRQIARILHDRQVIHSPGFFILLSKLTGKFGSFKFGTYTFQPNRYWSIIRKLEMGETYKIKVLIPEGWTSYQIVEELEKKGILSDPSSFTQIVQKNVLEGKLFPETYFFEPESDSEHVIQAMASQFKNKLPQGFSQRLSEIGMNENQILTMASIIEREAMVDSEREVISSVYHNRLKKRWPLEADPTVQYALSQGKYWKKRLTYKDLKFESPYNTYRQRGLPPGPICNPGARSIHAALYPARTSFFFFVADGKGSHYFSKTIQEHNRFKRKSRKERLSLK